MDETRDALAARLVEAALILARHIIPTPETVKSLNAVREAAAALREAPVPAPVEAPEYAKLRDNLKRFAMKFGLTHELTMIAQRALNSYVAALNPEAPPTREPDDIRQQIIMECYAVGDHDETYDPARHDEIWTTTLRKYREQYYALADRIAALYRGAPPQSDGGAVRAVAIATENRDAALAAGNVQAAYVGEAIRRELADLFIDGFAMGQIAPNADLKQEREDFLTRPENPFLPSVHEAITRMVADRGAPNEGGSNAR